MASRGFEFAYMLDGSNATPLIRDFKLSAAAAHKVGDLVTVASDGDVTQVTGTTTEVLGVMQEAFTAAQVSAGTTVGKVAIITREQVWKCSMDATSSTAEVGASKKIDTYDCNTISATDMTNGAMILVDKSETDDDGNVLAYVVFADATFGNE
ncbi:MAG TPA: hypothetical protein VMX14_12665 [Anaerolineae bacterium]|nr:hypothetical protein [Anaerolineae bacterium]